MANCKNTQQLNITCGTDVVLHDKLMFDGEVFDPSVSVDIECNLVNSLGKRTSLEYEIADETLIIQIPWVDGRNAGCYGLEVKGKCNGKTWATYADSLIRYTRATVEGAAVVEAESDWYDVTQVVSYRYSDSPLDEVDATIDDNYGEPSVTPTYEHNKLTLDFKNLRGNGIASVEQTTVSTEDEGVNEATITQDNGNTTVIQVRNGSKGDKGNKGDTGDSAIFDPTTGNISEMKQGTGYDALSPMSQKAVTDELYIPDTIIDLSDYTPISNYIDGAYIWATSQGAIQSIFVPVTPGMVYRIKGNANTNQARYAFLKSDTISIGNAPDWASGVSAITNIPSDKVIIVVAPSDANYINIRIRTSSQDVTPAKMEAGQYVCAKVPAIERLAMNTDEKIDNLAYDTDKDIYHNSKIVSGEVVYETEFYKTYSALTSMIAMAQMTPVFSEAIEFNQIIIGPVKRRLASNLDVNYRVCIKGSGDSLTVAGGGTLVNAGLINITDSWSTKTVNLKNIVTVPAGSRVCVYLWTRYGYLTPRVYFSHGDNGTTGRFNDKSQIMYFIDGDGSPTPLQDETDALSRIYSTYSTYYVAAPVLRLVKEASIKETIEQEIEQKVPAMIEDALEEGVSEAVQEAIPGIIEQAKEAVTELENVSLWLPNKIYAVVGDTLQLFYRGIVRSPYPYQYDVIVSCSVGTRFNRYYELTPTASQVGNKTLTIKVKNKEGVTLATKSITLVIVPAPTSPAIEKNIFCLGASLVSQHQWPNELYRRLTNTNKVNGIQGNGLTNINLYQFGIGGWTYDTFMHAATKKHRITVSGVTAVSVGASYTNNGNTYNVEEVNLTDGTGNLLLGGSTTTPATGAVLTRTSGSGDDSITIDTVSVENTNPLWDTTNNKFSFVPWVNANGGSIDVLYVILYFNGLSPWQNFSKDDTTGYMANLKTFANKFHDEYPNAKLRLLTGNIPSTEGGMGANYGAGDMSDSYGMAYSVWNKNEAIKALSEDENYSSWLDIVDVTTQFDAEYNYPITARAANRRRQNSTSVSDYDAEYRVYRHTNGIHPANAGYYQIADAVYRSFVKEFCQP